MNTTPTHAIHAVNPFGGVFFDVQNDKWLGEDNNFAFVSAYLFNKSALIMKKSGELSLISVRRNFIPYVNQGLEQPITLDQLPSTVQANAHSFGQIVAMQALQAAANERSYALYRKLPNLGKFYLLSLFESETFSPTLVAKNTLFTRKRAKNYTFDHSDVLPDGTVKSGSVRSFMQQHSSIVLTDREGAEVERMIQDETYRNGYDVEEYCEASRYINSAVMLVAKAIGPRARFDLLHYGRNVARVIYGNIELLFGLNGQDMIDLSVRVNDQEVEFLADQTSVPDCSYTSGAVISRTLYFSELAVHGHAMLTRAINQAKAPG